MSNLYNLLKTIIEKLNATKDTVNNLSQPDWNQNDETAHDHVKNRPFYTSDPVETVIVEESTVTFADTGYGFYAAEFTSTFEATVGETYKVSWDGTAYECTCAKFNNKPAIGNLSIAGVGSDTGEPFIIGIFNGERIQIITADTSTSHTLSISGFAQEVVKIDEKYLPDTLLSFKPAGKSYLTFSSPNSFTLKVKDSTKHWDGTLEYFASDKTWTTWDGTNSLSAVSSAGEYVLYLRGTGNTIITGSNSNYGWVLTGTDIKCIGNIENLLDYATVESGAHPTMADNCYYYMFYNCTSLTQAPALPATALATSCYHSMFQGCTSLTQAPALPATALATSCYTNMFQGCTALTKAPSLPATTLAPYCYTSIFQDCTALTEAPALPATTLADYCYSSMFQGCTSLTQAPALPATTLDAHCYRSMFQGCTSLTQSSALPATALDAHCYRSMFQGCTSLIQAPALPATTLADYCYGYMFSGCTSLKLSSTKTDEYTQEYHIPSSGNGTTAANALDDMFKSTGGTFTGTPSINTTYYLSSNNMIVRETDIATLNGYVGSMINTASESTDFSGSWNDLTDRPFYEGIGRKQLYSCGVDATTKYDDTYYVADLSTRLTGIYSGLNITVVISHDGIENTYNNVPIATYYIGAGMYEFDYLGGQDGYPFKITSNKLYVTASGYYDVYVYDEEASIIEQIPSKFIPTDSAGIENGSSQRFATNYQIKSYVESKINTALNAIGVAEEGAY